MNTLQLGPLVLLNPLALIPAIALLVAFFVWQQKKTSQRLAQGYIRPGFRFSGREIDSGLLLALDASDRKPCGIVHDSASASSKQR